MRNLVIHPVEVHALDKVLTALPTQGTLSETPEGLVYLNIDDRYIHNVFNLLQHAGVEKPPYFDKEHNGVGAHISVFYPEEGNHLHSDDWGQVYDFKIQKLISTEINYIRYFALLVSSPALASLRLKYGFPKKLAFKGYSIDFHITVALQIVP